MTQTLQEEILGHFNEPMLCMGTLVRCVGYGEDEMDAYIIMQQSRPFSIYPHESIIRHTCVGGYTFLDRLKGQGYVKGYTGEDWDDLFRLCEELTQCGSPKLDAPIIELHDRTNKLGDEK